MHKETARKITKLDNLGCPAPRVAEKEKATSDLNQRLAIYFFLAHVIFAKKVPMVPLNGEDQEGTTTLKNEQKQSESFV